VSRFVSLTVGAVDRLTDDAVALTIDGSWNFSAGQHLVVRRPGRDDEPRTYSLCSAPGDPLRIGVRRVADGSVSTWLVDCVRPGDVLEATPPTGRFSLASFPPGPGEHHVLVAAGSGITPVLSLATTLLRDHDARVTVLYANRTSRSAMFLDELADLKDRWPTRVSLVHVLSREPQDAPLLSGRLDRDRFGAVLSSLVAPDAAAYWLCGPWEMVRGLRAVLAERGVAADRVRAELFFVEDVPPPPVSHEQAEAGGVGVCFTLDGRRSEVRAPAGSSLLDAARLARSDVPFACRGGVCATCRARVVGGEVEMVRNFALEDDEVARGYVLTCQSYPRSDGVEVDYDA
jgi:ring-1,2-phenylacetyl-CoA epoxidase subunit PaaE